ncbi:hypothetical protein AA0Y32_01930 [Georgenia phoenicis]|uniref:hypothetical protein n=1 Tax=unclassified Georgenia TaxID=2626815 RepID=UPI0039B0C320
MRGRLLAAVASAVLAVAGAAVPAQAAYESQPEHTHANVSIQGEDHAGAQAFVPEDDELHTVGAWLVSRSASGTVAASVRTDVTDPSTEVAAAEVELGGTGSGWLELDLGGAAVTPGEEYALVLQAHGTDGSVEWWGSRSAAPGAPPSWNYDREHWGGWVQQGVGVARGLAGWDLAFYVNDALGSGGCGAQNSCWRHLGGEQLNVQPAGLIGTPGRPYALSAFEAAGARYVPGSSVLELSDGSWLYLPAGAEVPAVVPAGHPEALAQVEESRAWLSSGDVPGRTEREREMAERALLDMRLLVQDNGAVAAAWHTIWRYSWPRDSAFTAVALARAGFLEEALRILRYNARTQRPDGTWEARTLLDGSGPPDARPWQLDANGWVPWATWQYLQVAPAAERDAVVAELYPTVRAAADVAAASLDENGIPPARPDYWESGYPAPNLGTAAPLLAGLRSAAAVAELAGEDDDAARWLAAAAHLQRGIDLSFGSIGYQRTVVEGSGKDSAVAWLAPPFNPATAEVRAELDTTWEVLVQDTGGVQPGERWGDDMTWTPETMFFALAWASDGQQAKAEELVEWMDAHRTEVGAYPEKVGPDGNPAAVSTLGWTASLTVLTLDALETPAPTPSAGPGDDGVAGEGRTAAAARAAVPESAAGGPWLVALAVAAAAGALAASLRRRRRAQPAAARTSRR